MWTNEVLDWLNLYSFNSLEVSLWSTRSKALQKTVNMTPTSSFAWLITANHLYISYIWLRNRRSSWRQTVPPVRGIPQGPGPSPQWTCFRMHVGHSVLARAFGILSAALVLINLRALPFKCLHSWSYIASLGIARLWRGPGQSRFRQPPVQMLIATLLAFLTLGNTCAGLSITKCLEMLSRGKGLGPLPGS